MTQSGVAREDQRERPRPAVRFRPMSPERFEEIVALRAGYRLNDAARSVPSQALDAAYRALEECIEEIGRLRRIFRECPRVSDTRKVREE